MAIQIGLDPKLAVNLHETVLRILPIIGTHHNREANGGYFTCGLTGEGTMFPSMTVGCGDVADEEKVLATWQFSAEKAHRLSEHPDHVSSAQSRNFNNKKYAGAIRIPFDNLILSFSGLPEACDESLMLHVAVICHLLTREQALEIAGYWDNDIYGKL